MNKQELLEKIKALKPDEQCLHEYQPEEWEAFQDGFDDGKCYVELIIEQLDEPVRPPEPKLLEPEKPVVPEYVADMIVEKKEQKNGIVETIKNLGVYNNPFDCIIEKQLKWITENQEDFAKAWLYGYEIEKDKLYTVELPNPNAGGHVVLCKTSDGIVSIAFAGMARWKGGKNFQLTESEIKEDFEWAWQFAEDVEGEDE